MSLVAVSPSQHRNLCFVILLNLGLAFPFCWSFSLFPSSALFSPLAYPTQCSAVPPNLLIICSPFSLHLLSSNPLFPPADHNMIILFVLFSSFFAPSFHSFLHILT
jgi:hypothetical protein